MKAVTTKRSQYLKGQLILRPKTPLILKRKEQLLSLKLQALTANDLVWQGISEVTDPFNRGCSVDVQGGGGES